MSARRLARLVRVRTTQRNVALGALQRAHIDLTRAEAEAATARSHVDSLPDKPSLTVHEIESAGARVVRSEQKIDATQHAVTAATQGVHRSAYALEKAQRLQDRAKHDEAATQAQRQRVELDDITGSKRGKR